jgi:hypothetical protein
MQEFPPLMFRIGTGETKNDREWLKKKREYFTKIWTKNGSKILAKIEDLCGDSFTNTSKREGINILLHKKKSGSRTGDVKEENPLEIHLFLTKTDTTNFMKERLTRLLTRSFILQKYQFHFRLRDQTLFEDILADEFLTSMVSLMVSGKKPGKASCEKALDEAIEETVYRLSLKTARSKLLDAMCTFSEDYARKIKNQKMDILEEKENLIAKLLSFLPESVYSEAQCL